MTWNKRFKYQGSVPCKFKQKGSNHHKTIVNLFCMCKYKIIDLRQCKDRCNRDNIYA